MPLVFKNGDQTVRVLGEIMQKCKDHMSRNAKTFERCLYTKPERGTTTVYPIWDCYNGKFNTKIFEKHDAEVNPLKYLNVRCNVRAAICIEGILVARSWRVRMLIVITPSAGEVVRSSLLDVI